MMTPARINLVAFLIAMEQGEEVARLLDRENLIVWEGELTLTSTYVQAAINEKLTFSFLFLAACIVAEKYKRADLSIAYKWYTIKMFGKLFTILQNQEVGHR